MTEEEILKKLCTLPQFQGMSKDELGALAKKSRYTLYNKNKIIIHAGGTERSLFIILSGCVRVSRLNKAGKEVVLSTLYPGDVVGEIAVLNGTDRIADVLAVETVEMLSLSLQDFEDHIRLYPGLPMFLAYTLAKRLSVTTAQVTDLAFSDVSQRLIKALHSLGHPGLHKEKQCIIVDMRPTHQELASMIGTSREVVSRVLKRLITEEVLITHKKSVIIC